MPQVWIDLRGACFYCSKPSFGYSLGALLEALPYPVSGPHFSSTEGQVLSKLSEATIINELAVLLKALSELKSDRRGGYFGL